MEGIRRWLRGWRWKYQGSWWFWWWW